MKFIDRFYAIGKGPGMRGHVRAEAKIAIAAKENGRSPSKDFFFLEIEQDTPRTADMPADLAWR